MNLQTIRQQKNIEQADLAKRVGTNAPMMSNFEHYKCLPVPNMLKQMCEILQCSVSDIYASEELYITSISTKNLIANKVNNVKEFYKLTVSLPDAMRKLMTSENLMKCGYHSLKDFIWHCCRRFEKQLAIVNKKGHHENQLHDDQENEFTK